MKRTESRLHHCLLLLPILLLSGGCVRKHAEGLSDEAFIEAMVELRQAATGNAADPASFPSARVRILSEQNVTEEQLRAYIQSHVSDLAHIASVWETVNERLTTAAR